MRLRTIAFLLGVLLYQQLPSLPAPFWVLLLGLSLPFSLWFRPLHFPLWLANGVLITHLHVSLLAAAPFPEELQGEDLLVEGVVVTIPQDGSRLVRFEFEIERRLFRDNGGESWPRRVRLSWYGKAPDLHAGERWRLMVRLKAPHGFMNPGGFDYEAWLFRRGLSASGYVRSYRDNKLLGMAPGPAMTLSRLREELKESITAAMAGSPYEGIIQALAIGVRDEISTRQWQVLLKSGTNHLVAISGLHIGLVAGFAFFLSQWLWSRSVYLLRLQPAAKAAACVAIIAAIVYAALAGFAIPTQRALVMVVVFMSGILFQRYRPPGQGLFLALLLILIMDPLAVMEGGFWLSFAAVAVILYGMSGRLKSDGLWWRWGRVHWVVALALLPMTLFLFQSASVISPLANLVAVPWISFIVVPLVLVGSLLSFVTTAGAAFLLGLAGKALGVIWPLLEWLSGLSLAQIQLYVAGPWVLAAALLGAVWLSAPRGVPGRWLGGILLGGLFFLPRPMPEPGEAWFDLLDVGQGLAAVVQTRRHLLLFDAGPRFSRDFEAGESIILPFLRARGRSSIDMMIISHGDSDHVGGARGVLEQIPVARLVTSAPEKLRGWPSELCREGERWQWDGVLFQVLHPGEGRRLSANNRSCVLRVSSGDHSLLLSGDIEKRAERRLVRDYGPALKADILVVPHHGSRTSSTVDFIRAVAPAYALFPAGYNNRFRLPRPDIVERYAAIGSEVHASGWDGALHFRLAPGGVEGPGRYRLENIRYWHHRPEFIRHWAKREN